MITAVGVDGCRAGWVAASVSSEGNLRLAIHLSIADLDRWRREFAPAAPVTIDVPIGLPERVGFRGCDVAARHMLGPARNSVFQVPDRGLLMLASFSEVQAAVATRRTSEPTARGLTQQSFGIMRKIAEVDRKKKTATGRSERLAALADIFPQVELAIQRFRRTVPLSVARDDDVIDALAALWTGLRVLDARALVLGDGEADRFALRMRMYA